MTTVIEHRIKSLKRTLRLSVVGLMVLLTLHFVLLWGSFSYTSYIGNLLEGANQLIRVTTIMTFFAALFLISRIRLTLRELTILNV